MPRFSLILTIGVLLFLPCAQLHAIEPDRNPEAGKVLDAAESLFKSMQSRAYARIWDNLSRKSRQTIVKDTIKAMPSKPDKGTAQGIEQDFASGGPVAQAYWEAFLKTFDPVMVLEQSKWQIESIKGTRAQINITYRKSQKPAEIKMFKEDGFWKVGLTESFWTHRPKARQ